MTNDLKPILCGCGGKADSHLGKYAKWFIACDKCGVRTPLCDSRTEAVEVWNLAMSGNVVVYGNPDAPKSKTVG